jgi:PIN domain nuclease of toxin-antitoxin system
MKGLLLDTHTWLWFVERNPHIKPKTKKLIDDAADASALFLSHISTWELAMLVAYGKVKLTAPCLEWIEQSVKQMNIQLLPLATNIAVESCHLPDHFHGDPADRMIVATARIHDLLLLTKDQKILAYAEKNRVNAQSL